MPIPPLPPSFAASGFVPLEQARVKGCVMVGCDGPPDSGKTEFALSAPGPGMGIIVDRAVNSLLSNPRPPKTRQPNWALRVCKVPKLGDSNQADALAYWKVYLTALIAAIDNKQSRSILIDGDSDTWELQRYAEFGRLSKVPGHLYDGVNSARRAMYARIQDAGKIVIATNKLRKVFITKLDSNGKPELNNSGNEIRIWNGEWERQGFGDQEYLWDIQLRHAYNPDTKEFSVKIMKCKADMDLVGYELEGEQCNFKSLMQTVYPHIPLSEWGY